MITSSTWLSLTLRGAPGRGSSDSPSSRDSRNRDRHLPTIPNDTRSFLATDLLSSPSALASTTRALRARSDWLRARCAIDCSRSRSSSLRIRVFLGRPVRISSSPPLDAIQPNFVYLFLGQETRGSAQEARLASAAKTTKANAGHAAAH